MRQHQRTDQDSDSERGMLCAVYPIASLVIGTLLMMPHFAEAAEIERMYRSAYHLGIGDAGVAFARGADAVFYNPAGIAQSEGIVSEVIAVSPQVELARSAESFYREIQSGKDALQVAAGAAGKQQFVAAQNYSGIVFRRAAMGLFQRAQIDAFVGSDPLDGLPRAELGATAYLGTHLSYAREITERFLLGANVMVVQKTQSRVELGALEAQELASTDVEKYLNDIVKRGTGVGFDLGAMYSTDSQTKATFGAVVRNVGLSYYWSVEENAPLPDPEPVLLDLGISLEPETRKSKSRITLDLRDALDDQKENIYKRLHLGSELNFQDVLGGTVGLNQGYLTYGGYLRLWVLRVEAGVFSEEFGEYPGHRQSKRAYGRLSFGWIP